MWPGVAGRKPLARQVRECVSPSEQPCPRHSLWVTWTSYLGVSFPSTSFSPKIPVLRYRVMGLQVGATGSSRKLIKPISGTPMCTGQSGSSRFPQAVSKDMFLQGFIHSESPYNGDAPFCLHLGVEEINTQMSG